MGSATNLPKFVVFNFNVPICMYPLVSLPFSAHITIHLFSQSAFGVVCLYTCLPKWWITSNLNLKGTHSETTCYKTCKCKPSFKRMSTQQFLMDRNRWTRKNFVSTTISMRHVKFLSARDIYSSLSVTCIRHSWVEITWHK